MKMNILDKNQICSKKHYIFLDFIFLPHQSNTLQDKSEEGIFHLFKKKL